MNRVWTEWLNLHDSPRETNQNLDPRNRPVLLQKEKMIFGNCWNF